MRLLPSVSVAVVALGLSLNAAAAVQNEDFGFDTTEDLVQVCSTKEGDAEHVAASFACRAFIEATFQYHDAISDRKRLKPLVCFPPSATIDEGRTVFLAWAAANAGNAKLMNELPVVGLVRALEAKYPCR